MPNFLPHPLVHTAMSVSGPGIVPHRGIVRIPNVFPMVGKTRFTRP
ncbi:MAG: hypothetical protein JWL81_274 [Verrucomicrobiales bacterium]|nr:hypothetical protein [Verrucomicrobiales bacterium]